LKVEIIKKITVVENTYAQLTELHYQTP